MEVFFFFQFSHSFMVIFNGPSGILSSLTRVMNITIICHMLSLHRKECSFQDFFPSDLVLCILPKGQNKKYVSKSLLSLL